MEREVQVIEREDVQPNEANSLMEVISKAAYDPKVDVEKMERLLAMHERLSERRAIAKFNSELSELQMELPEITENGQILHSSKLQSKYALFEDINRIVKPLLQKRGFAVTFRTAYEDGAILVTAVLTHREGHREETTIRLPQDNSGSKNAVQGVGSSVSYGKRYTMCALLNITTRGEDDDGQKAQVRTIKPFQVEAIKKKLGDPSRIPGFCEFHNIENLKDLPVSQFDAAIASIKSK